MKQNVNKYYLYFFLALSFAGCKIDNQQYTVLENVLNGKPTITVFSDKDTISLKLNEKPIVRVRINNYKLETIKIFRPNSSSFYGGYPSTILWSIVESGQEHPDTIPLYTPARSTCGQRYDYPPAKDIIDLKPLYGINFRKSVLHPRIPKKKGKYSLRFYYYQDPNWLENKEFNHLVFRTEESKLSEDVKRWKCSMENNVLYSNNALYERSEVHRIIKYEMPEMILRSNEVID